MKAKKRKKLEAAIRLIREAIRDRFGDETEAKVIIQEDSVTLDGPDSEVICNDTLEDAVVLELIP